MKRRDDLQKRLQRQMLLFMAGIVFGLLGIAYFESIAVAVGVIIYMVIVSRYGYYTFRCPCCGRSVYKKVVNEANIFTSRVPERCPYCKCDFQET